MTTGANNKDDNDSNDSLYLQTHIRANELLNWQPNKPAHFKRLSIALFSDFCYPRKGGVENHGFSLAQELIRRGHKVVAITNTYVHTQKHNKDNNDGDRDRVSTRQHIRWMKNGFKIYYTPIRPVFDQNSLPIVWFFSALIRNILVRERIDIVHYHHASAFMNIANCISIASHGYATVFTDHSLYPFSDTLSIHINKGIKCSLAEVDQMIAVSNVCKENLTIRGCLNPDMIHVIPNAMDATKFRPPSMHELCSNGMSPTNDTPRTNTNDGDGDGVGDGDGDGDGGGDGDGYLSTINVIMITRMAFRKGIQLAIEVIPRICQKYNNHKNNNNKSGIAVRFIIGGDGPKFPLLKEMVDNHSLHDSVTLLGAVQHSQVRNTLIRGHIFLNCSLTESFCIAILEAACTGLYVVATNVGGVPEVLPPNMIQLCTLEPSDIEQKLCFAIDSFMDQSILRVMAMPVPMVVGNPQDMEDSHGHSDNDADVESKMDIEMNHYYRTRNRKMDGVRYQQALVKHRFEFYNLLRQCYSWQSVAERTEKVYGHAVAIGRKRQSLSFLSRLEKYYQIGPLLGKVLVFLVVVDILVYYVVCWLWPANTIEKAIDFPLFPSNVQYSSGSSCGSCSATQEEQPRQKNGSNISNNRNRNHNETFMQRK